MCGTEGAAADGEVLGCHVDGPSVDLAVAGHDAVAKDTLGFGEVEARGDAECADLTERALVKKNFEACTCGELALRVLLFDTCGTATGDGFCLVFVQFV